jgi:hypothetical protein
VAGNIGRSNEWKDVQVKTCLDEMLKSNSALYEKILDTTGFAYWFNILCIIASHTMWSVEDAQNYLRTGSEDRKKWEVEGK